jgi:site-specific recombinase XerD
LAHLRKRENGYYYAYWKEKRSNGGWYTMAKALKTKNKILAQKRFNIHFVDGFEEIKECYLEEWPKLFERSLSVESLDHKTVSKYIFHAKKFTDYFKGNVRKMSNFKHEHMIEFMGHLSKGDNSPSTVAGYGRSLRKMFNVALDLEYIRKNPMAKVKVGRMAQRQRFYAPDEIEAILKTAGEDEYSRALILFFLQTGFRIQEVVDSYWTNINHSTRTIKVTGKGKKTRIQKIPQLAYDAIMKLSGKWPTIFGRSQKSLYRYVKDILIKAKVDGSPHAFRDTYATYSLKTTMSLSTLRDRLGHGSLEQTNKYAHALNSEVKPEVLIYFQDWEIQG